MVLEGYDWEQAFDVSDVRRAHPTGDVSLEGVSLSNVVKVVACVEGENDYAPWLALGRLRDGRWFHVSAWCDYTGWDCQSGGTITVAKSKAELLRYGLTDSEKKELGV